MARKQHYIWLLAMVLIGLIAAYQIHNIQFTYMRDDEEIAFRTTSHDFAYTIQYQAEQDVEAPLWFPSFWLWQQVVGGTEFMARVLSILTSMVTLALVYQIGKTWFNDARFGLFGIAALGVNVYFYIYSLEIRPYAAVMLVATLSMWCFHRWLIHPNRRTTLIYGLTLALMMYIHYFLALLVAVQVIYLLVFHRPGLKVWRQWLGAVAFAFILWLPWFPIFINQVQKLIGIDSAAGTARGIAGISSTTEPTSLDAIGRLIGLMTNGQVILYAILLLIGLVYWRRKNEYRLLLLWGIGVPILALVANLVVAIYTPRYFDYLSIGFALAIGGVFAILRWRGFVLLIPFAAFSLWFLPSQLPINRIPHRLIFQQVAGLTQPGDAIFFDSASYGDALVRWQISHYLPADLVQNRVTDVEGAQNARRVWFVTQYWFNDDVKAHFNSLEPTHPVQTVFGQCARNWCYLAQLMEAPPWKTPQTFGDDMAFWGEDVISVTASAVTTHLWWRLEKAPPIDYSMSLQLFDSQGALVAQADGPVQHYGTDTVQTSQMQPGRIYIDYRSIALPPDLPAGTYHLALVVYDWQTNQRLLLPDGSDNLPLDSITLPSG